MKKYVRSSNRYVLYDGKQLALQDGETKSQAVSRYKTQVAKEEADALEAKRIAKEEKEARRSERRRTIRYPDDTVVMTKDGKYYIVYEGYYWEDDDTVYYEGIPCKPDGDIIVDTDDEGYEYLPNTEEIDQLDIKKRVK